MKPRFEKFYTKNYTNGFVMKKDVKKSWLGCKKEVIKLLKEETTDRKAIRIIEDKI